MLFPCQPGRCYSGVNLFPAFQSTLQGYLTDKKMRPPRSYHKPMPRVLGGTLGGGRFLVGEVSL